MSSVTRFNLLLLEEGEQFFEDYAASLYLPNHNKHVSLRKQLSGRLKVASRNLIFEPFNVSYPIMRFPYGSIESMHMDKSKQHLIVITSHIVKLKVHNISAPYIFEDIQHPKVDGVFVFEPSYSRLDDFVGLVAKIYQITKSKNSTQISIRERVNELMIERENKIRFDSSWFVDIDEVAKFNAPLVVSKLTPLVELRGQIQITSKRIYFQPFHNQSSNPMLKYNICDIQFIYKRRHIMLNTALELIIRKRKHNCTSSSYHDAILSSGKTGYNYDTLLLSFNDSQSTRDNVYNLLNNNVKHSHSLPSLEDAQSQWINGDLSNFDYLMFLNQQSGRSFNDLTQYPIFPWIITDYESDSIDLNNANIYRDLTKPIGALNPKRLQKILKRYKEMPCDDDKRFMYGSHYSSPAYVMYFLVRQHPEYMLRFQNGKYDAADRLFSSIPRTWESAYNSLTDVKELIPQFYDTSSDKPIGSFLLNTNNLNLGIRSDKQEVHHVELPKWSKSPKHFVETLRAALESNHVSAQLNHWIDLIWGYKQRGLHAEKAFNKFYYLTYEGAVDVEAIQDKEELNSIRMQINEFGQTPSHLFTKPHPQKINVCCDHDDDGGDTELEQKQQPQLPQAPQVPVHVPVPPSEWLYLKSNARYVCSTISPHSHRITDVSISSDSQYLFSTSHDSTLSVYSLPKKEILRSIKVSHLALSSCCTAFNLCVVGSWDNNIYIYNNKTNEIQQTINSHNDAVSCLDSSMSGVSSGSWDNTIKVWQFEGNDGIRGKALRSYTIESEARCIANCYVQPHVLINGDENGNIYMFDTRSNSPNACNTWAKAHTDEIASICWIPNKFEFISCSADCCMKHWDASKGQQLPIKQISTRENLNYVATDGNVLIAAGDTGHIRLFDNKNQFNEFSNDSLKLKTANSHCISKLSVTQNAKYIAVGTKQYSNNIHIFESYQHQHQYHHSSPNLHCNTDKNKKTKPKKPKHYSFGSNAFVNIMKKLNI
eukprot:219353_1